MQKVSHRSPMKGSAYLIISDNLQDTKSFDAEVIMPGGPRLQFKGLFLHNMTRLIDEYVVAFVVLKAELMRKKPGETRRLIETLAQLGMPQDQKYFDSDRVIVLSKEIAGSHLQDRIDSTLHKTPILRQQSRFQETRGNVYKQRDDIASRLLGSCMVSVDDSIKFLAASFVMRAGIQPNQPTSTNALPLYVYRINWIPDISNYRTHKTIIDCIKSNFLQIGLRNPPLVDYTARLDFFDFGGVIDIPGDFPDPSSCEGQLRYLGQNAELTKLFSLSNFKRLLALKCQISIMFGVNLILPELLLTEKKHGLYGYYPIKVDDTKQLRPQIGSGFWVVREKFIPSIRDPDVRTMLLTVACFEGVSIGAASAAQSGIPENDIVR